MKKMPLVSVVITCYNYGKYVAGAIESVRSQTYPSVEIIIIDDGSTDNTLEIVRQYQNDSRCRIVTRGNKGVIYTRNEGVRLSRGVYSLQLDADDFLEPTYIEECVRKAESEELDIVYTQARVFGRVEFTTNHIEHDLEKLKHENYIHATALVRTSKYKKNPYDEYLDKLGNEDWDLFLDLCLDGARAGLVNKPLLNYRKHTDRKSRADNFEGLYRESLVRHHIWQKQNEKHPAEFWYFSPQIDHLLGVIKLCEERDSLQGAVSQKEAHEKKLEKDIALLQRRVQQLERRDVVTRLKRTLHQLIAR